MHRLGIHLPLFIIHDLGMIFSCIEHKESIEIDARLASAALNQNHESALRMYATTLQTMANTGVAKRLSRMKLSNQLLSIVLIRVLSDFFNLWKEPTKSLATTEISIDLQRWSSLDSNKLFSSYNNDALWGLLELLQEWSMRLLTSVELFNIDTFKLMGLFEGKRSSGQESLERHVDSIDVLNTFENSSAADIVDFSLDLLPSIMETRRSQAAQTFAMDGYSSLERIGSIDSMMLSELAYDDEIFEQKMIFNELFYFGHEKQKTIEKSLHYVLLDSSASMRGKRQVFGRGLALALLKKLMLKGEEVWFRFFDSVLYECFRDLSKAKSPLPYILSFKSEHGRNYEKVFRKVLAEISTLRRKHGRKITVYIVTHGQCHIDTFLVDQLSRMATLYGIIILPSTDMTLDWVQGLEHSQVVSEDSFKTKAKRTHRALHIVDDIDRQMLDQEVNSP